MCERFYLQKFFLHLCQSKCFSHLFSVYLRTCSCEAVSCEFPTSETGELVKALGAVSSGIVWVDKC